MCFQDFTNFVSLHTLRTFFPVISRSTCSSIENTDSEYYYYYFIQKNDGFIQRDIHIFCPISYFLRVLP